MGILNKCQRKGGKYVFLFLNNTIYGNSPTNDIDSKFVANNGKKHNHYT